MPNIPENFVPGGSMAEVFSLELIAPDYCSHRAHFSNIGAESAPFPRTNH